MKLLSINNFLDNISEKKKSHFWIFLAALIILTFVMIYAYPLRPGHDFHFHQMRMDTLMNALRDGRFPFYLDSTAINGYGYYTNAFYCDWLLAPFALVGILTNSYIGYQTMIFTMTILTGIFMYQAVNTIYKSSYAASIASILYTFSFYRLLDVYNRGALGESLSFVFVPLVFLGLYHIISGDYKKWYIIAIGYTFLIFSHVIASVLMFITLVIVLIIYYKPMIKEPKRIWYLCIAGLATLILAAIYLYPMIEQSLSTTFYYEVKKITDPIYKARGPLQVLRGLFIGFVPPKEGFVPGIGVLLIWVICLRLFIHEKSKAIRSVDIGVLIGLFFICLSLMYMPWGKAPLKWIGFIQFPWRFYEFTTFFFAVAGGYYLSKVVKTKLRAFIGFVAIFVLCALMLISSGKDFENIMPDFKMDASKMSVKPEVTALYNLQGAEYIPAEFPSIWYAHVRGDLVESQTRNTSVSDFKREKGVTSFNIEATAADTLLLPLIHYKGYTASLNGKDIPISVSHQGLVQVPVSESGHVDVYFRGTTIQRISMFVSLFGFIALGVYILLYKRKKLKTEKNA